MLLPHTTDTYSLNFLGFFKLQAAKKSLSMNDALTLH